VASVAGYLLKADDNPDGVDESVFESMKSKIREDRPQFFKGFFKDFYGQGLIKGVSQGVLDWSFNQAMLASPKATLDCVDAFGKTDFRRDFAAFQVPTLVIHGTADATVPIDASGRLAARSIPGAELKEYEGAPHGLLATHQERATQDLLDFFA
jgi:non-heme chloroperoxidase